MKTAIIFNPLGAWDFHANFEVPIYHNLRNRGYKVIYLRCGLESKVCDLYHASAAGPRPEKACHNCQVHTNRHLQSMGIEYQSLSDFLDPSQTTEIKKAMFEMSFENLQDLTLFGINIYQISISSVHTHFRINTIDLANMEQQIALRHYMLNSALTVIAGKIILTETRPEVALIFNGRMSQTRAMVEICRNHGVRFATHERGLTRGYFLLNIEDKCTSHQNAAFIEKYNLNHPLKDHEVLHVKKWCNDRINGTNINWKNFLQGATPLQLDKKSPSKRWVLFTSSTDEFAAEPDFNSPFGTQYEWIKQTCAIANKLNVELIIRIHPNSYGKKATGKNSDEMKFFEELKNKKTFENLVIIDSDNNVNSYELALTADLVLAYGSTIAMESLLLGKKTYVAAKSDWIHCPSINSFLNVNDYEAFLEEQSKTDTSSELEEKGLIAAYRFMFNYLTKCFVNFPFIEQLNQHQNKINAKQVQDFDIGSYRELDHVVESILGIRNYIEKSKGFYSDEDLKKERNAIQFSSQENNVIRISVIITNYNYAAYLRNCIESVIAQDLDCVEIIIVDDGSTDHSHQVIEKIMQDYPDEKIKVIKQENSGQPAIPRNNGISIARGQYILPLDADDVIAVGYLKGCIEILDERPEVNLIFADSIHVYPDKNVRHPPGQFATGKLRKSNQIVIASLYSKELWMRSGGYKENVRGYEDWDLWLNMSMNGAITAYFKGVGLIYNAKADGLFSNAKEKHDKLYAQLILNNQDAYLYHQPLVHWARSIQA